MSVHKLPEKLPPVRPPKMSFIEKLGIVFLVTVMYVLERFVLMVGIEERLGRLTAKALILHLALLFGDYVILMTLTLFCVLHLGPSPLWWIMTGAIHFSYTLIWDARHYGWYGKPFFHLHLPFVLEIWRDPECFWR